MITPVAFENIKHHTYTVFAIINAIMVPVTYFCFPETRRRSLEEMDEVFAEVHGFKGVFDVVHVARTKPNRYGRNGELLIAVVDEKPTGTHTHSSEDGGVMATPEEAGSKA